MGCTSTLPKNCEQKQVVVDCVTMSPGHEHKAAPVHIPPPHESPDISEHGAFKQEQPQKLDRCLFVQLQVFTGCRDPKTIASTLHASNLASVMYLDVHDPRGIGLLVMTEDPAVLTGTWRHILGSLLFSSLTPRPEMTLLGRTYSTGREADLEDWLIKKPQRNALAPEYPWAVWYPLRRKPEFETLDPKEKGEILAEHAKIGMAYGKAGLAHDIRLACYGLDRNDNDFVLGLVSRELHPLSRLVQDMRKTQQTSRYVQHMGPFFIGKVFWQSPQKS